MDLFTSPLLLTQDDLNDPKGPDKWAPGPRLPNTLPWYCTSFPFTEMV